MKKQLSEKDWFVTETLMLLAKFGDYLGTVEHSLAEIKTSGLNQIVIAFGGSGKLQSKAGKQIFNSHRKRFEDDMGRFCRYSAVTTIYSLFETRSRLFIESYLSLRSSKAIAFKPFANKHRELGFVRTFEKWLGTSAVGVHLSHPKIWDRLQELQLIRHCIVHAHGDSRLSKSHQFEKASDRKIRRLRFASDGILVLEQEFAFEALSRVYTFFVMLFQATGYRLVMPQGYAEASAKQFEGFESEMAQKIADYRALEASNLGGTL